jgi:arylsulfatase A-like enzyme
MAMPRELNRREFLALAAATTVAASANGCRRPERRVGPPNLLFVMADQWRYSAFGHASTQPVATPQLDRFAATSVRCSRAYAANPVCSPSRASVMTGRLAHQHGVIANELTLPPSERGMAEGFREAGYATHYVGKWHLDGPDKPGFVAPGWRRRGFETLEGFNRGHTYERFQFYTNEGELVQREGFEPTFQTDRAIDFMREQRDRPFFCFLSWGPPHPRVNEAIGELPPWSEWSQSFTWPANVPTWLRRNALLQRKLMDYYALCGALDREVGRLLAALDDLDLAENTVVVFTSDHGDLLGSHGQLNKESPYEESLRVPLVVRVPDTVPSAREVNIPISGIDLMPTLAALCGLEPPTTCAGRDVSPSLTGQTTQPDESIYAEGKMNKLEGRGLKPGSLAWRAVVTKHHKLVVDAKNRVVHLANLTTDPYEQQNLANTPATQDLQATLLADLKTWKARTNDPFPAPPFTAAKTDPN